LQNHFGERRCAHGVVVLPDAFEQPMTELQSACFGAGRDWVINWPWMISPIT
jgi:hypothetical protein